MKILEDIELRVGPALTTYTVWVLTSLIDVAALSIWALFQYGLGVFISKLNLTGLDSWVFFTLQILTAISTLTPVALFIYKDIRIMLLRTNQEIQDESVEIASPNLSTRAEG